MSDYLPVFQPHVRGLRPVGDNGSEFLGLSPLREDAHPSFTFNAITGKWFDHGEKTGGNAITFLRRLKGLDFTAAKAEVERLTGQVSEPTKAAPRKAPAGRIVACYDYKDEQGQLLFQVVRKEPKDFPQRRPDGKGGWIWDLKGVRRVLYRLPELRAADPSQPVFMPEGEKDVNALAERGLEATCNPGGAGKWRPEYSETLRGKRVAILPDDDAPGREHARQVAASLRGVAVSVKVLELPGLPPKGDVSDWLATGGTKEELLRLAEQAQEWRPEAQEAPAPTPGQQTFNHTDLGNAQRLVARYGQDLRHLHAWNKWLVWTGTHWQVDGAGAVERMGKGAVRGIYHEAGDAADSTRRRELADHAKRSESASRLGAMIDLARSEPGIPVTPEELDRDPWLLNVANGTVDLKTGKLREHRREDLLTKLAPVEYQPDAACPTWGAFLERIFSGRQAVIAFLQRALGYSLTGTVAERVLFILHGIGRNGKTTLLEAIHAALGDYAQKLPTETMLAKRDGGIPNDIARLKGARFVSASETDQGRHLAESLIKSLTGGDTIVARFLHGEFFEFTPTHKILLATNHKPIIKGTDHAIWDRLRLIPFEVRIPKEEQDKALPAKLRAELPGILAWAVEGCLTWQREGLGLPAEVAAATEGYREEMDTLGHFLTERCVLAPAAKAPAKELYRAYVQWAEGAGEKPLKQNVFGVSLAERGLEAKRGTGGRRLWLGIGLLAEEAESDVVTHSDVDSDIFPKNLSLVEKMVKTASPSVTTSLSDEEEERERWTF